MSFRVRGRRFLLNPPGVQSTAAIVAEIEDTRSWLTGRFRRGDVLAFDKNTWWNLQPDVTLKFSDCDRAVTFSIDWDSPKARRASLAKVDLMIEALTSFRDALADEQRRYVLRYRTARLNGPPTEPSKHVDAESR